MLKRVARHELLDHGVVEIGLIFFDRRRQLIDVVDHRKRPERPTDVVGLQDEWKAEGRGHPRDLPRVVDLLKPDNGHTRRRQQAIGAGSLCQNFVQQEVGALSDPVGKEQVAVLPFQPVHGLGDFSDLMAPLQQGQDQPPVEHARPFGAECSLMGLHFFAQGVCVEVFRRQQQPLFQKTLEQICRVEGRRWARGQMVGALKIAAVYALKHTQLKDRRPLLRNSE